MSDYKTIPEVYCPLFTRATLILRSFHGLDPKFCLQCGGTGIIPVNVMPNPINSDCVCLDCDGTGLRQPEKIVNPWIAFWEKNK